MVPRLEKQKVASSGVILTCSITPARFISTPTAPMFTRTNLSIRGHKRSAYLPHIYCVIDVSQQLTGQSRLFFFLNCLLVIAMPLLLLLIRIFIRSHLRPGLLNNTLRGTLLCWIVPPVKMNK